MTLGNNNATATYFGSIQNPSGTGTFNIIKTGTGTQKLSGTDSYRGTTSITGGTLIVNGTHNGAGNYTVNTLGTVLGGTGTINLATGSSVTVTSGQLAPGDGAPGILTINGILNMSSIGTLAVELGGSTPGNGTGFYDQVRMNSATGAINTSFAHISVSRYNGFAPQPSDIFYILDASRLRIVPRESALRRA